MNFEADTMMKMMMNNDNHINEDDEHWQQCWQ